jgi:hypothetical protein
LLQKSTVVIRYKMTLTLTTITVNAAPKQARL